MCFWAVWWWSGAGGNCDHGGPLWTNGQHGYKIDCLIIMYYNCTGVEWSSDPPTNRRFFEVVPQKVKRRFPPKSARGVALVDLKVWRGQFNDKRVQYSPSFASETAKIRPEGRELVQTERACAGGCGGCVVWKMARLP